MKAQKPEEMPKPEETPKPKEVRDDATLQKLLAELKRQREDHLGAFQACNGAIQVLETLLKMPQV